MKVLLLLIISLPIILQSCSYSESDLVGTYVSPKLENNIDTLILKKNGEYYRGIYRKSDGTMVLMQSGKWKVKSEHLVLENFHLDYDNEYSASRKFDSGLMDVHLTISSGPSFDYGAFSDGSLVYEKVD